MLVLSHDLCNARSETVIAIAITSQLQRAGFPLTYPLPEATLPHPSWVKISHIRTISVDRLGKRLASLPPEDLDQILDGLQELIG